MRLELEKRKVEFDDDILNKIAEKIMGILYAKGGAFSNKLIKSFTETYIENGLYKKVLM